MKTPKVLIIDDESIVRKAMQKALRNEGYKLYFAENGEQGLSLFAEIAPDLAFLDLRMPVMDGFAFLNKLQIKPKDPFLVVVITGHGDDKEVEESFRLGVNFFLRKPLSLIEVCCLARRCIDLKAMEADIRRHQDNLQKLVTERTAALEEQIFFQQTLINSIPTPIFYKNTRLEYLGCNTAFADLNRLAPTEIIGRSVFDLLPAEEAEAHTRVDRQLLRQGGMKTYQGSICHNDGYKRELMINKTVYKDKNGAVSGLIGASFDITELVRTKEDLTCRSHELEEVNTALRVLLKEVNRTRENIEKKIVHNIRETVMPHLEQLEDKPPAKQRQAYLEMAMANLDRITSSFPQRLSSSALNLSPREIQVADFVKMGKTNKETARLMKLSCNAVEFHRNNLRKKLGLKGRKTNLRTHLMNME